MATPEDKQAETETGTESFQQTGDRVSIPPPEPDDAAADDGDTAQAAADRARDDRGRFAEGKPTRRDRREAKRPAPDVERIRTEMERRFDERVSRIEQTFNQRLDAIRQQAAPAASQKQQDPLDREWSELNEAIKREALAMQNHDTTKGPYDFTYWNQLQDKRTDIRWAMNERKRQQPQQAQQGGMDPVIASRFTILSREFPEVAGQDRTFAKLVGLERTRLMLEDGAPDDINTDLLAAANVRARRGGGRPARGNERAQQYRQGPGGGGERNGTQRDPEEVTVSSAMLQGLEDLPQHLIRRAAFRTRGQ